MNNEDVQTILTEFNRQLNDLRKDFQHGLEKLADKISHQSEINISCSKDIESVQMIFDEKSRDMKSDINGIADIVRTQRTVILEDVDHRIKKGDLSTRLAMTVSLTSGMGAVILFLLSKFL